MSVSIASHQDTVIRPKILLHSPLNEVGVRRRPFSRNRPGKRFLKKSPEWSYDTILLNGRPITIIFPEKE